MTADAPRLKLVLSGTRPPLFRNQWSKSEINPDATQLLDEYVVETSVRFGINKLHPAAASDTALMGIGAFRFMWGPVSIGRRFSSLQFGLYGDVTPTRRSTA
jgi:hypothetical protein